ncbi:MAG: ArsR/SmtB family transcription factor [Anaerolineales bacterium]
MPIASNQVVQPIEIRALGVSLEPAQAIFSDLFMLDRVEKLPGLDPWIERTVEAMGAERWQKNHEVINGVYYALVPKKSFPDVPSYLEDLEQQDPTTWVTTLLEYYERMAPEDKDLDPVAIDELLADFDRYLDYLKERFAPMYIDEEVERQAHRWINDPPRMQREVMEHLRFMWERHLEPGWQRALPLLQDCVRAFGQIDWPEGSNVEIARWVTGQELKEHEMELLAEAERVVFVPSTHVGPYTVSLLTDETLWVTFGARIPEGASLRSQALSRSQLLVRLNALADENRLYILDLLRTKEELCAQDIIEAIELSQSSASRHLRQLTATGYLLERRRDSAKCYRLNPEQSKETVKALAEYLNVEC